MTQPNTDQDPDEFLTQSLEAADEAEQGGSTEAGESTQNDSADRGTQDATEKNNGSEEPSITEVAPSDVRASNSESEKPKSEASKSTSETKVTETQAKKLSPSEQRKVALQKEIQDTVALKNKEKAELEAIRKERAALTPKEEGKQAEAKKPLEVVPRPVAPKYKREELRDARAMLKGKVASGEATAADHATLDQVEEELGQWRDYDLNVKVWELQNGQEVKQLEGAKAHYLNMAASKWPELKDVNTPHFKTYDRLNRTVDEWMKGPQRDYYVAEMASIILKQKTHEAELGARNKEIEQLKKENQALKAKFAPAQQVEATEAGESDDNEDPDRALTRQLREARGGR